jgi:hypothetical protein
MTDLRITSHRLPGLGNRWAGMQMGTSGSHTSIIFSFCSLYVLKYPGKLNKLIAAVQVPDESLL